MALRRSGRFRVTVSVVPASLTSTAGTPGTSRTSTTCSMSVIGSNFPMSGGYTGRVACSRAGHPEGDGMRLKLCGFRDRGKQESECLACIARVDHAVVEHAPGRVEHIRLATEVIFDLSAERVHCNGVDGFAAALCTPGQDCAHGQRRLFGAHQSGLCVGPRQDEIGVEATAVHAVVAGSEACADSDGDLWDGGV